jgi:hypothetical protein
VFSSARRRRSSKERRRDRRQSRKKTIEGRLFLANFSTNMLSPPPSLFGSAGSLSRRGPCEEKGTRRARLQRRGELEKADPSCFSTAEVFCVWRCRCRWRCRRAIPDSLPPPNAERRGTAKGNRRRVKKTRHLPLSCPSPLLLSAAARALRMHARAHVREPLRGA